MKDTLLKYIKKDPETGCWIWTGQVSNSGYGRIVLRDNLGMNRMHSAHQACYTAFVGPLDDGMLVRQTCRNRLCVNPDHLETFRPADKGQWAVAPDDGAHKKDSSD